MIKGTKTIAQYKIMQWVQEQFEDGSVEVTFTAPDKATITDKKGDSMEVIYSPTTGVEVIEKGA